MFHQNCTNLKMLCRVGKFVNATLSGFVQTQKPLKTVVFGKDDVIGSPPPQASVRPTTTTINNNDG